MKKIPLIITLLLLIIISIGIGLLVFNMYKNQTSIVQSSKGVLGETKTDDENSLSVIHSNQWYSNLYKGIPSSPIYAFPLSFKIVNEGLGISYPKPDYKENTVFGTYNEDFVIGIDEKISGKELIKIGDFSINFKLKTDTNKGMDIFLGHGFPYTKIKVINSNINISSREKIFTSQEKNPNQESKIENSDNLIIKINNKNYLLVFDDKKSIEYLDNSIKIIKPNYIFIAIVDDIKNLSLFKKHSLDEVLDTKTSFEITDDKLITKFSILGKNENYLFSLLPHQYENLSSENQSVGKYLTIRGEQKLYEIDNFSTEYNLIRPEINFKPADINKEEIKKQLQIDIENLMKNPIPDSKNYFLGTWIGMVSNLAILTDNYHLSSEKQKLLEFAAPIFEDSLNYYEYNRNKTSLISSKPEFGNDELNDHHFHYGYYLRFGSILLRNNFVLQDKSRETLSQMALDIANTNRSGNKYPYIRNFDIYESHSWADGYGNTNDGNNQESSSEAINAWYSVYLWGLANDDLNMQNTGLYLYNSEIEGALYYWFDKNKIYNAPYAHRIASIIWGGKVDFATWFSPKTNMIYGIQLLPFTPASDYLAELNNFIEYESDYLKSGGNENDEWADLYLMLKSYHQNIDISQIPENLKNYDRNPKSLIMYFLSKNKKD